MALVINSNIMSMNAQRNISSAQSEQNQAMERLTSGKRINSAADDAAGLAISNRMTSQIKGLDQAIRNANDGISLIQTAEGALDESTNILQRMRELSVQSANGTYDEGNRNTLNAEVQQLVKELDRISETTSFNGQNVLDGSLGSINLQVGSESNQTISFEIESMDSKNLGLGSVSADVSFARMDDLLNVDSDVDNAAMSFDDGDILVNGTSIGAFDGTASDASLDSLLKQISSNVEGVTATASNNISATNIGTGVMDNASDALTISVYQLDGGASDKTDFTISGSTSLTDLAEKITSVTNGAVNASVDDEGKLQMSNDNGATIKLSYADGGGAAETLSSLTGITDNNNGADANNEFFYGTIGLTSDNGEPITISKGANGTDADLNALGLMETTGTGNVSGRGDGEALQFNGSADVTIDMSTQLVADDLKINGVSIDHTGADNLQTKVDNINKATSETNVTASIQASDSFDIDLSTAVVETTGANAVDASSTSGDTVDVNGTTLTLTGADTADKIAAVFNANVATTGVSAYVDDANKLHFESKGPMQIAAGSSGTSVAATELGFANFAAASGSATAASTSVGASGSVNINNVEVSVALNAGVDKVVDDINAKQGDTGVRASIDDNGELKLESSSSITLSLGQTNGIATADALGMTIGKTSNLFTETSVKAGIELNSTNGSQVKVEVTKNGMTGTGLQNTNSSESSTTGNALANIDITTAAGAQKAIDSIDNALEKVNEARSELGAVNNRLDFTINNLSNVSENASAARSRIEDADFAKESANLSRAQVLQQAGSAMLAQANAAPQQVLSLLQ